MNHQEDNECFANYAYHHSETLEMDRGSQMRSSTFRTTSLPSSDQDLYDSSNVWRNWDRPETIQMTTIGREHSELRPRFTNMNPYENNTGFVNPGFEPITDESYSSASSVYDGHSQQDHSFIPDLHGNVDISNQESVVRFFYHYFKETYPDYKYTEAFNSQEDVPKKPDTVQDDALEKVTTTTPIRTDNISRNQVTLNIDEDTLATLNKINDARWKAAAKRRRSIGTAKRLASLAGLSFSQFIKPELEISEEEKEEKRALVAELVTLSPNERARAIQELTVSMDEKREIRDQVYLEIGPKSMEADYQIASCTQLLTSISSSLRRFRENMIEIFHSIHPWHRSLKVIGGKFGTGVLSYFTFLKWLLMFNVFSFLINFSFITIPQFFALGPNNLTFTGLELLTGAGYFTQTVFYYGFYTNASIQASPAAGMYNMQLAYFLTFGFYMLICFLSLVYSIAKSFNENFTTIGTSSGEAARLLCSWDFNITNEKTVQLKKTSLSTQLKEMLSDKMHYKRQLTRKQKIVRCLIHLMTWIISLGTTLGCCMGVYFYSVSNFQQLWHYIYRAGRTVCIEYLGKRVHFRFWLNWLTQKLESGEDFVPTKQKAAEVSLIDRTEKQTQTPRLWRVIQKDPTKEELQKQAATLFLPFLVASINLFIPLFFSFLGFMERFKYPWHEIYVLIIRNVLLKMSIIGVLCYYWLVIVADTVECWETFVGQDLYRLVVTDFIFSLFSSFFGEFIRSVMGTHCCPKLGIPEFDIARNVLALIYAQTLGWIGLFFAPLLPAIQIIKFFITFHVKKVSLMMNCQPPRMAWRASHMTTIFIFLLFFPAFIGVLCLIGVTVWRLRPSEFCGPFRGLSVPYSSISRFIHGKIYKLEGLTWIYNNLLVNPLFFFILTIIVFAIIYLYWQIIDGRKMMAKLLQEHIINEGKDKTYLLQKLTALKIREVSDEAINTIKFRKEPDQQFQTRASESYNTPLPGYVEESPGHDRRKYYLEPNRQLVGRRGSRQYRQRLAEDSVSTSNTEELNITSELEREDQGQSRPSAREEASIALALALAAKHQAEQQHQQ